MAMVIRASVAALALVSIILLLRFHVVRVSAASGDDRISADTLGTLAHSDCSKETFPTTVAFGGVVPYASSLAQLTTTLVSSASSRLFHMTSSGSGSDTAYGAYQCRGDLELDECSTCISVAASLVSSKCPQAFNGRVVLDACSLFYQNTSIAPDDTLLSAFNSGATNNDSTFSQACQRVLNDASAAAPSAPNFYGTASEPGGGDVTVYGYAQCYGYLTPAQCEQCLSFASSTIAYYGNNTGFRMIAASCIYRYEDSVFLNPTPVPAPAPAPDRPFTEATPASTDEQSNRIKQAVVIGATTICSLLLCAGCGFFVHRKWTSTAYKRGKEFTELQETLNLHQIRVFTEHELKAATRNFQESNKLGEGGFGSVYKGTLQDKQVVAIKKLTHSSHHGKRQFLAEVETITGVRHRNLIRLLGCCIEGQFKYIIYEYLPNQSLDRHIFEIEGDRKSTLPWSTRRKIILGTAKGLMYLHHESNLRIIHRDIKAANILLDDNLEPKIADFGLARLFASDQTHLSTVIAGTIGYLAPEYTMHGQLTEKSDTYSFGLVVLEILSGRRVNDGRFPPEQQGLLTWTWTLYDEGRSADLMDPLLKGEYAEEEVSDLVQLALLCTQTMPALRPYMSKVVAWLEGEVRITDVPRKPELAAKVLYDLLDDRDSTASSSGTYSASSALLGASSVVVNLPPR